MRVDAGTAEQILRCRYAAESIKAGKQNHMRVLNTNHAMGVLICKNMIAKI